MVLNDKYSAKYCLKCDKIYTDTLYKWCKQCHINHYKDFTSWNSGIEKVDNLVRKMQLKIIDTQDMVFEWIPYDQFNDVEKISKGDSPKIFSAIWKDGPLCWNNKDKKYIRDSNKIVALKCLGKNEEFLNKVWNFLLKFN